MKNSITFNKTLKFNNPLINKKLKSSSSFNNKSKRKTTNIRLKFNN